MNIFGDFSLVGRLDRYNEGRAPSHEGEGPQFPRGGPAGAGQFSSSLLLKIGAAPDTFRRGMGVVRPAS